MLLTRMSRLDDADDVDDQHDCQQRMHDQYHHHRCYHYSKYLIPNDEHQHSGNSKYVVLSVADRHLLAVVVAATTGLTAVAAVAAQLLAGITPQQLIYVFQKCCISSHSEKRNQAICSYFARRCQFLEMISGVGSNKTAAWCTCVAVPKAKSKFWITEAPGSLLE